MMRRGYHRALRLANSMGIGVGAEGSLARTLVSASLSSAVLRIVGIVATFITGVQLARYLGPEELGYYGVILSLIAVLGVPAQLGLPLLATRELAANAARGDWRALNGVLRWFTIAVLCGSVAVSLVSLAALLWFADEFSPAFVSASQWGLLLGPAFWFTVLLGAMLRGLHRVAWGQALEVLLRPALFALALFIGLAVFGEVRAREAIILHVIAGALVIAIGLFVLRRSTPAPAKGQGDEHHIRLWVASAFPMALTEALRQMDGVYGTLMISAFASAYDVGIYRVALASVGFVALPVSLFNMAFAPTVARLHSQGDFGRMQQMLKLTAAAMFACVLLGTIILAVFGKWLVITIFGAEFGPAWPVLLVLCLGQLTSAFFGIGNSYLAMVGAERNLMVSFGFSLVAGIGVAFLLIPQFGSAGAAAAAVVGIAILNIRTWRRAKSRFDIDVSMLAWLPKVRRSQ